MTECANIHGQSADLSTSKDQAERWILTAGAACERWLIAAYYAEQADKPAQARHARGAAALWSMDAFKEARALQ